MDKNKIITFKAKFDEITNTIAEDNIEFWY